MSLDDETVSVRGQLLVMVGELKGTVDQIDGRMIDHDDRVTKILEDHEKRLKCGEKFRNRLKGAVGTVIALGGTGAATWWKANGF